MDSEFGASASATKRSINLALSERGMKALEEVIVSINSFDNSNAAWYLRCCNGKCYSHAVSYYPQQRWYHCSAELWASGNLDIVARFLDRILVGSDLERWATNSQ